MSSRRQLLLEALWGGAEYREPRTIDVHVRHLREKLEPDPREPRYILTVRGVGYRFRRRGEDAMRSAASAHGWGWRSWRCSQARSGSFT